MKISDFPDGIALLSSYPNLIVSRTFSKAYGLAGLRVGYAVASPAITNLLNRVRQPFNVNSYALHAAAAALHDDEHLQKSVHANVHGMTQLIDAFEALGLGFIPSAGNFVSVDTGRAAAPLYNALLQRGVIVRPVANYAMPNHLRISIGTKQENAVFIRALEQVLSA
jgi:histidinol-phosphate aminotransferase